MPELPDVEQFKRYLDDTALHQTVASTSVHDERALDELTPQSLGQLVHGRKFTEIRRHGKHLFVHCADSEWLDWYFKRNEKSHRCIDELPSPAFTQGSKAPVQMDLKRSVNKSRGDCLNHPTPHSAYPPLTHQMPQTIRSIPAKNNDRGFPYLTLALEATRLCLVRKSSGFISEKRSVIISTQLKLTMECGAFLGIMCGKD